MDTDISSRLRAEFKAKVFPDRPTLPKLAERIGVSYQALYRFLHGKRSSLDTLNAIAKFLDGQSD